MKLLTDRPAKLFTIEDAREAWLTLGETDDEWYYVIANAAADGHSKWFKINVYDEDGYFLGNM